MKFRLDRGLSMNQVTVGTSRCDVPARATAGGIVSPQNAARGGPGAGPPHPPRSRRQYSPKIVGVMSLILFLALLGGCAVGPNYKRPAVNTPDNFRFAESQGTNSFGDLPWWEGFKEIGRAH